MPERIFFFPCSYCSRLRPPWIPGADSACPFVLRRRISACPKEDKAEAFPVRRLGHGVLLIWLIQVFREWRTAMSAWFDHFSTIPRDRAAHPGPDFSHLQGPLISTAASAR